MSDLSIDECLRRIEQDPGDSTARVELGKIYRHSGRLAEAEGLFRKLLEELPGCGPAWFELGNVCNQLGRVDEAVPCLERSCELEPSNHVVLLELSKLYRRRNETAKAKPFIERYIAAGGTDPEAARTLAAILRLEGEGKRAEELLRIAALSSSGNEGLRQFLAKAGEVKGARKDTAPYRVFITWGMHYACNYRCSYCNIPRPGEPGFGAQRHYEARYPGTEQIVRAWEKVAEKYGPCRIRLDGGEPSVYPDFIELVGRLSRLHWLQLNTNLSFDVRAFCAKADARRVRVDASLHLDHVRPEEFAEKLQLLRDAGFRTVVSVVAWPPYIPRLRQCRELIEAMGIPFLVHPFTGTYQGKAYPAAYTAAEKKAIYNVDDDSQTQLEWRAEKGVPPGEPVHFEGPAAVAPADVPPQPVVEERATAPVRNEVTAPAEPAPRGEERQCRMGQMYARIYPSGAAFRCCTGNGLTGLGNLYDGSFSLLEEPRPCDRADCKCWRCMTPGEEQRWLHTWVDDWELP